MKTILSIAALILTVVAILASPLCAMSQMNDANDEE